MRKGHMIRVAISSSNFPRFLNNPNTDDPISKNSSYNIAHNKLYIENEFPSRIILPYIEQLYNQDNKFIINGGSNRIFEKSFLINRFFQ